MTIQRYQTTTDNGSGLPTKRMDNYTPSTKETAIQLFNDWINQRPNLEYVNYGNPKSYRQEQRNITKQLHQARIALIQFATLPYNREMLNKVMHNAFSGRLTFEHCEQLEMVRLEYTTGQYWPTEYRLAAAVVLERYNREMTRHALKIFSLHDAKAVCVCGWYYLFTGEMTKDEITKEYKKHL